MSRFRRPSPGTVIAVIALVVAGAGTAVAAIPGDDGVISSCYSTKSGDLRVIDLAKGQKCGNMETSLAWNRTGPQGPQGPKGDLGAPGISHGFQSSAAGHVFLSRAEPSTIADLTLAPGSYQIDGVVTLASWGAGEFIGSCRLLAVPPSQPDSDNHNGDFFGGIAQGNIGQSKEGPFSVVGMVTLPSTRVVRLVCSANSYEQIPDSDPVAYNIGGYVSGVMVGDVTDQ
jgi:hypothetical protein